MLKKHCVLLVLLCSIFLCSCSACSSPYMPPATLTENEKIVLTVPDELNSPFVLPTQQRDTPCNSGEHLFVPDHCCLCGYAPSTIEDDIFVGWFVSEHHQSLDYATSRDPFDGTVYIPEKYKQTTIKEVHMSLVHDDIEEIILSGSITFVDIRAGHYTPDDTTKVKRIVIYGDGKLHIDHISGLEQLTEIVIDPNRQVSCGNGCFRNCSSLLKLTLPDIEVFSQDMFENCNNLKEIVVQNTLKEIEWGAFSGCSSLQTIHFLGTKEQWKRIEFSENIGNTQTITVYCTNGTETL